MKWSVERTVNMKKQILLISLLALVGCDTPQRTRAPATWINGNSLENPTNASGSFTPSTTGGTTSGTTTTGGTTPGNLGAGFEGCDIGDKYHTVDIGFFGLCQSTQSETSFKFRTSLTSTSVRTCIIPTYKDSSGSSTWIGQPQCTYTTQNQVVSGSLYKDRQGFNSYPLNGAIVMKEPLLPEYFNCMQGYVAWPGNVCKNGASNSYCSYWLPRCAYGGKTNAQCDTEARNYMGTICNQFKTKYSNSYIDIKLR
jgi:hypothetical protein